MHTAASAAAAAAAALAPFSCSRCLSPCPFSLPFLRAFAPPLIDRSVVTVTPPLPLPVLLSLSLRLLLLYDTSRGRLWLPRSNNGTIPTTPAAVSAPDFLNPWPCCSAAAAASDCCCCAPPGPRPPPPSASSRSCPSSSCSSGCQSSSKARLLTIARPHSNICKVGGGGGGSSEPAAQRAQHRTTSLWSSSMAVRCRSTADSSLEPRSLSSAGCGQCTGSELTELRSSLGGKVA